MNLTRPSSLPYPKIRRLVHSPYLDIFAVSIILTVSLSLGYHKTFFYEGQPVFGLPVDAWAEMIQSGAFPLGIFSIVVACFSMLSTRFMSKQHNLGNIINIGTTICVCLIDYLLGNKSAVITYPVTFMLSIFSTVRWAQGEKIRDKDLLYYMLMVAGMLIGYVLVFVGFYIFDQNYGWYDTFSAQLLFHSIAITFGLSLGANAANAFKYQETWISWTIYNIVQITKNVLLANWANLGKYIFYFFNAAVTYVDWKFNGDVGEEQEV